MNRLVAADIGGTHARFALASISDDGAIHVDAPTTLATAEFDGLQDAWHEFARRCDTSLPPAAAIAIAAPVVDDTVRMTNNRWVFRRSALCAQLGVERVTVVNDFAAVAHAAARASEDQFLHLAGPHEPLPGSDTVSVIGPGTGLGVAHFRRFTEGGSRRSYVVQPTEGGHTDFAPLDATDDLILARLRERHSRVSVERVVSGPGIVEIHAALAHLQGAHPPQLDDRTIWHMGLAGQDDLAEEAVDRFCHSLGSVAGDLALAHGAGAVVIAGGLGYRLRHRLPRSGFAERFRFKGRYQSLMANIPVRLLVDPQPGLLGAVAAFQIDHGLMEPHS